MITLESNIEFLTNFNAWRRDISDAQNMLMPSPEDIGLHLDFAIAALKNKEKKESQK